MPYRAASAFFVPISTFFQKQRSDMWNFTCTFYNKIAQKICSNCQRNNFCRFVANDPHVLYLHHEKHIMQQIDSKRANGKPFGRPFNPAREFYVHQRDKYSCADQRHQIVIIPYLPRDSLREVRQLRVHCPRVPPPIRIVKIIAMRYFFSHKSFLQRAIAYPNIKYKP
mgnify:CR=1 FL=1